MSILGSLDYTIVAKMPNVTIGGDDEEYHVTTYVDNFDTLRRTIATTWSKIPHIVRIMGNEVTVSREDNNFTLATFEFKDSNRLRLPDHF